MPDWARTTRRPERRPVAAPCAPPSTRLNCRAHHWPCGSGLPDRCRRRAEWHRISNGAMRMISVTSASRMLTRGSPRLSPKISAIGPRAQATTAGTSSTTTICALLPSAPSAARSVKPMPRPPIEHMRFGDLLDLLRRERRERGLRAREAAVHQLVGAEHDRKLLAAAHQAEFIRRCRECARCRVFPRESCQACSMPFNRRRPGERRDRSRWATRSVPHHRRQRSAARWWARCASPGDDGSTRSPTHPARSGSSCRDRRSSAGRPRHRRRTFRDRSRPARP